MEFLRSTSDLQLLAAAPSRETLFAYKQSLEPLLRFVTESPRDWNIFFAILIIVSSVLIARTWALDATADPRAFWSCFLSRLVLVTLLLSLTFSPAFLVPVFLFRSF